VGAGLVFWHSLISVIGFTEDSQKPLDMEDVRMKRASIIVVFLSLLFAFAAQAQMQMPKPGPEHKKLDYFLGTWSTDGDMKPGPMGPGGFFIVIHSDMKMPMGTGTGLAVMGYNADQKKYTYHEFNSMGEAEAATGTVDGDTWTWTDENMMNGNVVHGRYTMKILSPTSYTFKYEVSQDGNWTTVMDGKTTKTK
jgi:hypothetical protein